MPRHLLLTNRIGLWVTTWSNCIEMAATSGDMRGKYKLL